MTVIKILDLGRDQDSGSVFCDALIKGFKICVALRLKNSLVRNKSSALP